MSNPADERPLAPPRSLSKPPTSANDAAASHGGTSSANGANGVPSANGSAASSVGAAQVSIPPEDPKAEAAKWTDSAEPAPVEAGVARSGDASPVTVSPYAGSAPSAYSLTDVPTEPALPPLASPYAPAGADGQEEAGPMVDKRAERKAERAAKKAEATRPRTVRRAKLRVVRVDPWSVTKTSFLLSISFGIMCVVAVFLVMSIISASGLWGHINDMIQGIGLTDNKNGSDFDITEYVYMSRVMGITMLISAVDVVIITAMATLGAFIYNMAASLLGGVEVTLAEDLR